MKSETPPRYIDGQERVFFTRWVMGKMTRTFYVVVRRAPFTLAGNAKADATTCEWKDCSVGYNMETGEYEFFLHALHTQSYKNIPKQCRLTAKMSKKLTMRSIETNWDGVVGVDETGRCPLHEPVILKTDGRELKLLVPFLPDDVFYSQFRSGLKGKNWRVRVGEKRRSGVEEANGVDGELPVKKRMRLPQCTNKSANMKAFISAYQSDPCKCDAVAPVVTAHFIRAKADWGNFLSSWDEPKRSFADLCMRYATTIIERKKNANTSASAELNKGEPELSLFSCAVRRTFFDMLPMKPDEDMADYHVRALEYVRASADPEIGAYYKSTVSLLINLFHGYTR